MSVLIIYLYMLHIYIYIRALNYILMIDDNMITELSPLPRKFADPDPSSARGGVKEVEEANV